MKRATAASVLACIVYAAPFICAASPLLQTSARDHQILRRISYRRSTAPVTLPLARMDLTPRDDLRRPYDQISPLVSEDRVPTAVSGRLSPNGPVGTVGLVQFSASHAIDPAALTNAVANQPGAPSQTVGAALAYTFR